MRIRALFGSYLPLHYTEGPPPVRVTGHIPRCWSWTRTSRSLRPRCSPLSSPSSGWRPSCQNSSRLAFIRVFSFQGCRGQYFSFFLGGGYCVMRSTQSYNYQYKLILIRINIHQDDIFKLRFYWMIKREWIINCNYVLWFDFKCRFLVGWLTCWNSACLKLMTESLHFIQLLNIIFRMRFFFGGGILKKHWEGFSSSQL